MLKNIYRIIRAMLGFGEEVTTEIEIEMDFVDLIFLLVFIGLLVYAFISFILL